MSHTHRSLAVDPEKLAEQAHNIGRHQQSWQLLLDTHTPAIAPALFGEGLAPQAGRITASLDHLHRIRQERAAEIQQAARRAARFARDTGESDAIHRAQFDQVLP